MKALLRSTTLATLIAVSTTLALRAEDPPAGYFDLGKFNPPSDGGQFVEVNVKSTLLNLAAKLTEKQEPDVADLLRNIKSIRVNVVGLDDTNRAELTERLGKIRADLESKGWDRVVTVLEKGQDVGIYLKHRGDTAIEGIVVTVIENGKEAVFVNVVGDISPEKLSVLGDRLGIEPLKNLGKPGKKA